jgi:hypothetical protein
MATRGWQPADGQRRRCRAPGRRRARPPVSRAEPASRLGEWEHPFHPAGLPNDDDSAAFDASDFAVDPPPFSEVLEVRADRQSIIRHFIARVTAEELAATRRNPHAPAHPETVRSCLHTILEEEWEHHRYAVRDLGRLAAGAGSPVSRQVHPGT